MKPKMRTITIFLMLSLIAFLSNSCYAQSEREQARQHYEQGKQYYEQGRYKQAQEEFQKALSLISQEQEREKEKPAYPETVLEEKEPIQVVPVIEKVDLKKKLKKHYKTGRRYYKRKDYIKAKEEFEQVIALDADYKDAGEYLVYCHQAMLKEKLEAEIQAKKETQEQARKEAEERRKQKEARLLAQRKEEEKREEPKEAKPKVYTISEEDVLDISVWGWDDLHSEVIVRPDGKISFPLVGDVQAAGQTLTELDEELTERLKEYIRLPEVSVMITQFGGKKVIVLGEVASPGVYRATGKNTIMEVIARAGGFTDDAVSSSVILVRGGLKQPRAQRVNLAKVIKKGELAENISVQPEDVVYVPRKFIANINYFLSQLTPALEKADFAKGWESKW